MRRRVVIAALGAAVAWPLAGRAQPQAPPVIGFLGGGSAEPYAPMVAAFRRGLGETGFVEGSNLTVEYRWAEGSYDRLSALVAELVRRRVAAIVAVGGNAPAQSAKEATTEIPIVFVSGGEPIKAGLVNSLARPGGNLTGISFIAAELTAKRLELLHQLIPKADKIGVLVNPNYPDSSLQVQELEDAAAAMHLGLVIAKAASDGELDPAMAALENERVGALFVANDPFLQSHAERIVALATRHALPAFYYDREYVAAGGLVSYGASLPEAYRQAGVYAGRVLRGAKPADLPVLQPTTFELVVNLKTATALGIEVPSAFLARADEVIE